MRGAVLFFITIVMVTSDGRAVAAGYVQQTMFNSQLPYSDIALAVMAFSALVSLLLLCGRTRERRTERWIWQIRVLEAGPAVRR
jgi:hypothetical protein